MKVSTHQHDVERVGVEGEQNFSIKTTAQAFDILSSGIYSDPILAVVRELSCNAWDAHKDAGKEDVPFEVHLPTRLEPWFSVIDHGIGLSDDDARGLYTTYFESTKSSDNDKIGAFGLGSKSPFSYSKAFEVIVRFEGKKRTYSIFLNEHGVPTIATLATIDTDECNGVEVKLAVRREDHHMFAEKVAQCLRYFPVKPIIKGSSDFKFQDRPEDAIDGDGYYVFKNHNYGYNVTAVQGNVPYKVDGEQISGLPKELKSFLDRYSLVGFFEIGQLDVAASREEIRYEKRTMKNLVAKLEKAREDFLKRLDDDVNALTKAGKKWDVYCELKSRFAWPSDVKNVAGNYKFSSPMFAEWLAADGYVDIIPGSFHTIKQYRHGQMRAVPQSFSTQVNRDPKTGDVIKRLVEKPSKHIHVILNDVTKRSSIRMNRYLEDHHSVNEIIAIAPSSDRVLLNAGKKVPTAKERQADLEAILKSLGNPTIVRLSEETEDVTVTGKKRKSGHTFKKYKPVTGYRRSNDRRKPEFTECDEPEDGGLYVEITLLRDTIVGTKQVNWNDDTFRRRMKVMLKIINHVDGTEYKTSDIYGLTKKVAKHVAGNKDWKRIDDLYKAAVVKLKDVFEVHERLRNTDDAYGIDTALTNNSFINMVGRLPASSHFRTTVEPAITAVKDTKAAEKVGIDRQVVVRAMTMNDTLGVDMKLSSKPYFKNSDFVAYKMLKHTGLNAYDSNIYNDFREYIELIEAQ